ncbi:type 11 methyltransferase [Arthrobacter crystallopoietes BAB-32]|uniref:Type 11 methyltransferase n=2 Tax=Crystallibacter crystallopoietes TaxID=37928 RepID=N1UU96_9MICC|nr:type 11 methyltransferase [Arthrobacter crystallopoietes BAB-32]
MDDERRKEFGRSFEEGGEHYERIRPGYPDDAVDWLLPPGARDAADLGAGTGKYTEQLLNRGLRVTAVDPSADMLAQLRKKHPQVEVLLGTAEHTGLADASFDVVTVAQAWHWVDPAAGSAEAARILRHGGTFGLVWNQLDVSIPWVHRLSRIMHAGDVYRPDSRPTVGPEFTGLENHLTRWTDPLLPADIIALAKSRSYCLRASEQTRAKVLSNLDWYLHEHLGHTDSTVVPLPYLTLSWRAVRK